MSPVSTFSQSMTLAEIGTMRQFMQQAAEEMGFPTGRAADIIVAANEAITNILVHGYQMQGGRIEIEVRRPAGELIIILRDDAPLFDPTSVPVPDTTMPLERRGAGGMGVHMMRHFADALSYRVTADGQNELTLVQQDAES